MKKILALLIIFIMGNCALALGIYKLDNGQTVVIQEVRSNPIVTVDTWIKTGSIDETDKNNGVAHFLEHLFFKGTKKYPSGEFDRILENKGAITNAGTSKDYTHFYITIPSQYFDLALGLHADMLLNPLIPRKEMEMERKVVLEEIAKDLNSPSDIVYNNLIDMLYTTHPYKRKVIGTQQVISTITRDDVMNFYNEHYLPSNMVTVIIGDVNTAQALAKVKEYFTGEYKKPVKTVNAPEKRLNAAVSHTQNFPTQTGYLLLGFRSTPVIDKDSYALDVLSVILGGGRSSVLNQSVKENKQLAFSISAVNSGYKEDGIFYISANFTPEKLDKLQQAIFEEIQKIQKDGITPEQLQLAKNIIETNTYYERESISNIASEIGYTFVTTGDIKYYDTYLDDIKKVTAREVKEVANKYLGEDKSAASILLPEKKPEKLISNKSQVSIQEVSKSHGTQALKLSTGLTMLVTQNDVNDIIAISIVAKGGYLVEKIPGTADMVAAVMTKGTEKYTSVELAQILEDNGIKISPSAGSDAFTINILTTKKQYQKTLELLDEIVNNAAFLDNEIEKTRAEKLSAIKRSRDVPLNLAAEGYKTLIYEGSPYSNSSAILEKTLPTVQRDDIVSYYNNIFNPQNMVVSINGNLSDLEDTYAVFGRIFQSVIPPDKEKNDEITGMMPRVKTLFNYSNYSIPDLKSQKTVTKHVKDLKTDWILIGWQAPSLLNQKDYAAFEIIDAIAGTGMSSRLFKNLRIDEGLAYQLGSQYGPNVLKGAFIVYIGTNPENLEVAKQKLLEEVFRFKTEFVSSKELQEAKDKLIGQYIISQETNLDKASTLGWFEASGRGYQFDTKYADLINSITESDIIEVANKYLNDNYVLSIVK